MKVTRQLGSGLQFEADADSQVGLFEALAAIDKGTAEVFGETQCGCCGSNNIYFRVRAVEHQERDKQTGQLMVNKKDGSPKMTTSKYYEMACRERGCWATLSYGLHREGGTMYPRRKDKDDEWLENRGWKKWEKKGGSDDAAEERPAAKATNTKPKNTKKPAKEEVVEDSDEGGDEKPPF